MAAESRVLPITSLYLNKGGPDHSSDATRAALIAQADRYAKGEGVPRDVNQAAIYYWEAISRDIKWYLEMRWHCYARIEALYQETQLSPPAYVLWALSQCYLFGCGVSINSAKSLEYRNRMPHSDNKYARSFLDLSPIASPSFYKNAAHKVKHPPQVLKEFITGCDILAAEGVIEHGTLLTEVPGELSLLTLAKEKNLDRVISSMVKKIHELVLSECYKDAPNYDFVTPLPNTGLSPLFSLLSVGHEPLALQLLRDGADFEEVTPQGKTILHLAAEFHCSAVLNDADVRNKLSNTGNVSDQRGRTPLHYAAQSGNLKAARLLIEHYQANPDSCDKEGYLPLHLAAEAGQWEFCEYLLSSQIMSMSPFSLTHEGQSVLHLATNRNHLATVLFLLRHDFQELLSTRNTKDQTPLDLALLYGRHELARILLLNGAQPRVAEANGPSSSSSSSTVTVTVAPKIEPFKTFQVEHAKARVAIYERRKQHPEEQEILESLRLFINERPFYPLTIIVYDFISQHTLPIRSEAASNNSSSSLSEEITQWLATLPTNMNKDNEVIVVKERHPSILTPAKEVLHQPLTSKDSFNSAIEVFPITPLPPGIKEWFERDIIATLKNRLFGQEISPIFTDLAGRTLLHYAASADIQFSVFQFFCEETELAQYLDHPNDFGNTPLHTAARSNNIATMKFLLDRLKEEGASFQPNGHGDTPLHLLVSQPDCQEGLALLSTLPSFQAWLQHRNIRGDTPLHIALKANTCGGKTAFDFLTTARTLLLMGADPEQKNKTNKTCFDYASPACGLLLQELELEHYNARKNLVSEIRNVTQPASSNMPMSSSSIAPSSSEENLLKRFMTFMTMHPRRPLFVLVKYFQTQLEEKSEQCLSFLDTLIPEKDQQRPTPMLPLTGSFAATTAPYPKYKAQRGHHAILTTWRVFLSEFKNKFQNLNSPHVNFDSIMTGGNNLLHLLAARGDRGQQYNHWIPTEKEQDILPHGLAWLLKNTILAHRVLEQNDLGSTPFYLAASCPGGGAIEKFNIKILQQLYTTFESTWSAIHDEPLPLSSIHQPNRMGNTPLHGSVQISSIPTCLYLLGLQAPIDATNNNQETPLLVALQNINWILYAESHGNYRGSNDTEHSYLHMKNPQRLMPLIAQMLLLNNANPDVKTKDNCFAWEITPTPVSLVRSAVDGNDDLYTQILEQTTSSSAFFEKIHQKHRAANRAIHGKRKELVSSHKNTDAQIAALEMLTTIIESHPHRPLSFLVQFFKTLPICQAGITESLEQQRIFFPVWDRRCDFEKWLDDFILAQDKNWTVIPITPETLTLEDQWKPALLTEDDFSDLRIAKDPREFVSELLFGYRKNPAFVDSKGNTLLHIVAEHNIPVLDLLFETDLVFYIDFLNTQGLTPFARALTNGHLTMMKQLYEAFKKDPSYVRRTLFTVDKQENNLFHHVASKGNVDAFSFLLTIENLPKNCTILDMLNASNSAGHTPLHLAVNGKHKALVSKLLENNADPRKLYPNGYDQLDEGDPAIQKILRARIEVLEPSVKKVAPSSSSTFFNFFSRPSSSTDTPPEPSSSSDTTPVENPVISFWNAVANNDVESMTSVYEKDGGQYQRACLIYVDEQGNTPLHLAAQKGLLEAGAFLLCRGAQIHAQNKAGDTPLHLAMHENKQTFLSMLLLHDADPYVINAKKEAPYRMSGAARCVFQRISREKTAQIATINTIKESTTDPKIVSLLDQLLTKLDTFPCRYFSTHLTQLIKDNKNKHNEDGTNVYTEKNIQDMLIFLADLKTPSYRCHFIGEYPPELPLETSPSGPSNARSFQKSL